MSFSYDYNELSNEVLFQIYTSKGELKAFEELLNRHKRLIYAMIYRYVKNQAHADEVFQDVFFKVCKNKDQFRESVSFKSWLVTIAKNTSIDFLRKQKREQNVQSLDPMVQGDERSLAETVHDQNDKSPLQDVIESVENEQLNTLLEELPQEQKETFMMKVIMEMTFEEIAEAMKVSINTAKSRHRYALKALRGLVKRQVFMKEVVS